MPLSSLHRVFLERSAHFEDRAGWLVPDCLEASSSGDPEEAVLLFDLSHWPKSEIHFFEAPIVAMPASRLWPLTPRNYLSVAAEAPLEEFDNATTTDVSSVYTHFYLLGTAVRQMLARLSALDLSPLACPDGACLLGPVARVRCIVKREDIGGISGFHLLCSREYGVSVCEILLHSGKEFSAQLAGDATLNALGKPESRV